MDLLIVSIIVAIAIGFTLKSFVKIYKGEDSCGCGGCSCSSKDDCNQDFPMAANSNAQLCPLDQENEQKT
ncbi:MAG: FeoB-associated Cys-rich membrane protein [Desulfobacula sp.]|nr:FeoB-associated Cys-rich membrane protein [Desulfobacula sp.]